MDWEWGIGRVRLYPTIISSDLTFAQNAAPYLKYKPQWAEVALAMTEWSTCVRAGITVRQ